MAANATAVHPILTRLATVELFDQLDELERILWADGELDRRDLSRRVGEATQLAAVLRDSLEDRPVVS